MIGKLVSKNYTHFYVEDSNENILWRTDDITKVHSFFPNDIVEVLDDKLKLIRRDTQLKNIVGILHTSSKIKHGLSKQGNLIYTFQPLDSKLPEFLVSSKLNNQTKNHWASIEYLDWSKTSKRPRGGIQQLFGPVGNKEIELESLIKHYRPTLPQKKHFEKELVEIYSKYESGKWKENRQEIMETVVSIDPESCQDIDDSFSLSEHENCWKLGIHISDLSEWISPGSYLDQYAFGSFCTMYLEDKNIPIFPRELSDNFLSLQPGKERATITLSIEFTEDNIQSSKLIKTWICNSHKLTYNKKDREKVLDLDWDVLDSICKKLNKKMGFPCSGEDNIEVMMIYYNNIVANQFGEFGLFRQQEKKEFPPNYPKELSFNAAKYTNKPGEHYCLGLDKYTHATSPIRRYADILVQRLISKQLECVEYNVIEQMNLKQKLYKKFERDYLFLNIVYDKERQKQVTGVVLEKDSKKTSVYIPGWKQIVKVNYDLELQSEVRFNYYIDMNQNKWKKKIIFELIG